MVIEAVGVDGFITAELALDAVADAAASSAVPLVELSMYHILAASTESKTMVNVLEKREQQQKPQPGQMGARWQERGQ
jgi:hypothetical protein